jgi:hypothetical protein
LALQSLPAQNNWVTVPEQFAQIPGNVALSLPARWSKGTLQVILDAELLLPLAGQSITHLRMRKPAFLLEGAYASRQLDFKVTLSTAPHRARFISGIPANNRGPDQIVVFDGPVNLAATPAPAAGDRVGADLIDLVFNQPYQLGSAGLTIEWETGLSGTTMDVSPEHWVDAAWHTGGIDQGLAVTIGQGGCNSAGGSVVHLEMNRDATPGFGKTLRFKLSGAPPNSQVHLLVDLVDEARADLIPGYGGAMDALGLPDCRLWTRLPAGSVRAGIFTGRGGQNPPSQQLQGVTDGLGELVLKVDMPDTPELHGRQMTAQALVAEGSRLVASNGLVLFMNQAPFKDHAALIFVPDDYVQTIWAPWRGGSPILQFGF